MFIFFFKQKTAYEMRSSDWSSDVCSSDLDRPGLSDVAVATGSYGAKVLSNDDCATRGITPCFDRAVQVSLTAQRTLPFISIFPDSAPHFTAKPTAALVDEGEYCVVSLYEGTSAGTVDNGHAKVNLGRGIITNTSSAPHDTAERS